MTASSGRRAAWALLVALYVLRNDIWWWHEPSRLFGLPVGLSYHLLFVAAVVAAMGWLVRFYWPEAALAELAGEDDGGEGMGDADEAGERCSS